MHEISPQGKHAAALKKAIRSDPNRHAAEDAEVVGINTGLCKLRIALGRCAMRFWAAPEEVDGKTCQQRCCMHKTLNILNCLPKSSQPKAKGMLHEIWQAETGADSEKAFTLFIHTYEAKYPKATLKLQKDHDELLAFYDFPTTQVRQDTPQVSDL